MRVLTTIEGLRCWRTQQTGSVGFVPTMGALHTGHLSLIERARAENQWVIVSIFVNPLQFGPSEDLDRYPRPLEKDRALCEAAGADAIFVPTSSVLYGQLQPAPATLMQVVPPAAMLEVLCGPFRPGHFQGVATVVTKLLNLVQPDHAYFGQKDAQQLAILRRLADDLNLSVKIIGCPIVRELDGLALSSRNQYLDGQARQQAAILYRGLSAAKAKFAAGARSQRELVQAVQTVVKAEPAVQLEYVELVHPLTLTPLDAIETIGMLAVAAQLGNTRLIDNVTLRSRRPIIAIDGPAGAGKSTVARRLARQLGLLYLDTGAMYRALTWFVLSQGADPQEQVAVAELLSRCDIRLTTQAAGEAGRSLPQQVWVNGQEVTEAIREPEVTAQVSAVAAQAAVREALVQQQKQYGAEGGVIADGRDIGTHVFPHAELKVFLTASVQERAQRRQRDLAERGQPVPDLAELEQLISERDRKDSTRAISPLQKASDAIEIDTDMLSIEAVIDKIVALYTERVVQSA
ncbi:MAG: bifunctional pantoate--beta-alanine ligase/(d)CMP kinase [Leptolyngbya sp. SIO4C1]|nr:bifunctional pantoate--beta-alanine ligase/(d)CMP kinase [Leptolyngbya sp. SIO4C1]